MLREMGLAQYLKFCVRSKSMVLGTMERIFLNRLSHHLQLCKDHFRDLKKINFPGTMDGLKATPKLADGLSLNHDIVPPAFAACRLLPVGDRRGGLSSLIFCM